MAIKLPKTRCNGTLTESQYWSFIRSGLRAKSRRWAPIYTTLAKAKRPNKSKNKRLKWETQCALCSKWFPQKECSVDHVNPIGSLTCAADLPIFVEALFCEMEGLQVLCKTCHDQKTKDENETRRMERNSRLSRLSDQSTGNSKEYSESRSKGSKQETENSTPEEKKRRVYVRKTKERTGD